MEFLHLAKVLYAYKRNAFENARQLDISADNTS